MTVTGLMEDYGGAPESDSRCFRDYEGEIAKLKAKIKILKDLKDSIETFLDKTTDIPSRKNEKYSLLELFGILTFETRGFDKRLEGLIKEWDAEIAKKRTKETE